MSRIALTQIFFAPVAAGNDLRGKSERPESRRSRRQPGGRAGRDWSVLEPRAEVTFLREPMPGEDEAARVLAPFHVIIPMRERTPLPGSLIRRLPNLRMVALTGARSPSLDIAACTTQGALVCNTGINTGAATAELAFTLLLNCARAIPLADATMRRGGWHAGLPIGDALSGKRLGILGLGKLGSRVAGFGKAFGMEVVAWSQNLTPEAAAEQGVARVEKDELFATSDAISIHLVLSDRSRGLVGEREIGAMKPGAILVNTSRGPIVDEAALVAALREGRITGGARRVRPGAAAGGSSAAHAPQHRAHAASRIFDDAGVSPVLRREHREHPRLPRRQADPRHERGGA
jgi:phosphoglycerate dehydrogenase-like enzyme